MLVQVVRFVPHARVRIERGENAGRTLDYHNIVTEWDTDRRVERRARPATSGTSWRGTSRPPCSFRREGFGPILAAARAR